MNNALFIVRAWHKAFLWWWRLGELFNSDHLLHSSDFVQWQKNWNQSVEFGTEMCLSGNYETAILCHTHHNHSRFANGDSSKKSSHLSGECKVELIVIPHYWERKENVRWSKPLQRKTGRQAETMYSAVELTFIF